MERVKLQPGDYVATKGMTEEQYHAVCKAFIAAGARIGEYGAYSAREYDYIGWRKDGTPLSGVYHFNSDFRWVINAKRKLTINQILETKMGVENNMSVKEAYKIMQANCGIEVGDTVRVLRSFEEDENGCGLGWNSSMGSYVGLVGIVKEVVCVASYAGLYVAIEGAVWAYPFFVLELVKKGPKLPKPISISSSYECKFNADKSIDVGCQHIPFELIEKIYLTAKGI